jgi:hypothetical protein
MKKIIAAAVATAFVAPVMAADVTVSGLSEFYYKDVNGATSSGFGDHAVYIKASTETANGLSVSADININSSSDAADATSDGSDSITVAGPFGSIDLGDTSSASDKFDDRADTDVVIDAISLGGDDAAIGWTLPTVVEGLTAYVSHTPDSADHGDGVAGTGFAFQYTAGPVTVAYGDNQADADASNEVYVGGTVTVAGVAVSAEQLKTGASGSETKENALGLSYTMGDVTFNYATEEAKNASGTVTADVTFVGVKYALGGGVTAFAETSSDDKDATADTTAVGIAVAF